MDDDFLLFLNSGDVGTEPLDPGQTTVRSAFRQRLEIPLTLTDHWQVALLKLLYTNSYGNARLKSPDDFHVDLKVLQQSQKKMRLNDNEKYTHYGQVLQDMVRELGIFTVPTLSGDKHLYGHLRMEPMGLSNPPSNTKLDMFRSDIVAAYQRRYKKQAPFFPVELYGMVADYLRHATNTLFQENIKETNKVWDIWPSLTRPSTHYTLALSAVSEYDLGESLALMMGFLEPNPDRPGQTRMVPHNSMYVNTGNGTRAEWQVTRLDTDHDDTQNEGSLVGGVNIRLDIPVERLPFMRDKYVEFDMGAWVQDADPFLPYLRKTPVALISLKPDEWLVQLKQNVTLEFKHGLDLVFGKSHWEGGPPLELASGATYILPDLKAPLNNIALTDVDLTRCHTEVDVVEFSPVGNRQRQLLATLPLSPYDDYGLTVQYDPQHLDFRPLAGPTRNLDELRVHLRNSEDTGVPFYTGLTGVWLYFRKTTLPLQSAGMSFAGGRRVTLESDGQRDLFPSNTPSRFRLRLPEQWTLDATWEVALVQLLMPHTFHNVQDRQIQCSVHYPSGKQDISLAGGLYVTLTDVVLALHQAIETESPVSDAGAVVDVTLQLNKKGFYEWTFPTRDFSLSLPGWLARLLGYLDWETWTVPFYYKSDVRHPTVEITNRDTRTGRPTEVEITRSHTMALPADHRVWSFVSPYSFQNIYVHCNVAEPAYVGSQMAKVVLIHGVNPQKGLLEDVPIPHLIFSRLSHFTFRDLEIDIRDNLGRPIPFQGGNVTAALYFRRRKLP